MTPTIADKIIGLLPESIRGKFFTQESAVKRRLEEINSSVWNQLLDKDEQEAANKKSANKMLLVNYKTFYPETYDQSEERIRKFYNLLEAFTSEDQRKLWPFTYKTTIEIVSSLLSSHYICRMYRHGTGLALAQRALWHTILPSVGIPAVLHPIATYGFLHMPLLSGEVSCSPCHVAKSALVFGTVGFVHPLLLSSLTCFFHADNCRTMALPEAWLRRKESRQVARKVWRDMTLPLRNKLLVVLLLNMGLGALMSSLQILAYYTAYSSLNKAIKNKQELKLVPFDT